MNIKIKKILYLFLIIITIFPVIRTVINKKDYYQQPFDLDRASKLYGISQYVQMKNASWIADELLYSYASWNYINGGSPIIVNPENLPLVKYIIGVSIKLLNNDKYPVLIFSALSLLSLFLLSNLILKNKIFALIPVGLLSWEKLFNEQLIFMPLFEVFALTFLILTIYFFIKADKNKFFYILSSLFLGALWSSRPWMATIPLLLTFIIYLLLFRKNLRSIIYWSISLITGIMVLLLSYHSLFLQGESLYKVLSVQKWILWYHQSRLINIGTVWPYIYFDQWYIWWGDNPIQKIEQWTLIWPIFTTLAIIASFILVLNKFLPRNKIKIELETNNLVIGLWVILYLGFLSIGNISSRYVFYLFPFCYILGVNLIKQLFWHKNV